ncbi:DpnI domain-containing protein [Psychrobacter sp. DAB_AL62B]|uniref:DpnI domain-containing protein n=1 Tax=Psychrobacter sp. DAB_AL62B TaxID=1028420 RepID=UPI002380CFF5|nr:DpnI domain-containing protein [Psychrobacter sp. DAB_AL62B]MDE4454359.1 hypothetical protein [Psychrobacter sp. DAB_AL62B]
MNLNFNQSLAKNYKSPSQIIRVLSEDWVANQSYCPNCNAEPLSEFTNIENGYDKKDEQILKIFQIEIIEMLSNIVEVGAENEQEALLKAQEMYRNEEVFLYSDDFIGTKFNIFE